MVLVFCLSAFNFAGNNNTFKKLYVLEGTWKMDGKRGAVYEEWKKLDRNTLAGRSYILINSDTIVNETIKLANLKAGIFYTATVAKQNNNQPVAFKMTQVEDDKFVFENPEHDFPKRIIYKLVTTDSLHAIIDDGTKLGVKQNFYFKRQ